MPGSMNPAPAGRGFTAGWWWNSTRRIPIQKPGNASRLSKALNMSSLVAKFAGDVKWDSMDGSAIKVAIALLVPGGEAGTTHMQLLSKVAALLLDDKFRDEIKGASDAEAVAAAIVKGL